MTRHHQTNSAPEWGADALPSDPCLAITDRLPAVARATMLSEENSEGAGLPHETVARATLAFTDAAMLPEENSGGDSSTTDSHGRGQVATPGPVETAASVSLSRGPRERHMRFGMDDLHVARALQRLVSEHRLSQSAAAARLGISRKSLWEKRKRYGLD